MSHNLTGTGVWSSELRYGDKALAADAAAELESLGYSAVWLPDIGGDLLASVENLMSATKTITIATGILNLWMHDPAHAAAEHARLTDAYGNRFLMGIGVSHSALIDAGGPGTYARPYSRMVEYLDALDAAEVPVATADRVLAALRPKMIELARARSAGAHPYLVTPEQVAETRDLLGVEPLLAPELGVILETDADDARVIAREHLSLYLTLPNYTGNWLRSGFEESDLHDGGSDRLVDALVVWGDESAIAERVAEFRQAGADHVCIQVLTSDEGAIPLPVWRTLAPVLIS